MKITTYIADDIPVEVEFDYQPYEKMTDTYPGCFELVTVENVFLGGDENKELYEVLNEETLEDLAARCLVAVYSAGEL